MLTPKQIKNLNIASIVASIAVPVVVMILLNDKILPKITLPFDYLILPQINAVINSLVAVCLVAALYFIKQKNIAAHKAMTTTALVLSVLFLLTYVLYHWSAVYEAKFGDTNLDHILSDEERAAAGSFRLFYLFLLISHIILAAIIIPFVLFTYIRGLSRQDDRHKALARYTFPMWLYVSVTGVLCYVLAAPYYGH